MLTASFGLDTESARSPRVVIRFDTSKLEDPEYMERLLSRVRRGADHAPSVYIYDTVKSSLNDAYGKHALRPREVQTHTLTPKHFERVAQVLVEQLTRSPGGHRQRFSGSQEWDYISLPFAQQPEQPDMRVVGSRVDPNGDVRWFFCKPGTWRYEDEAEFSAVCPYGKDQDTVSLVNAQTGVSVRARLMGVPEPVRIAGGDWAWRLRVCMEGANARVHYNQVMGVTEHQEAVRTSAPAQVSGATCVSGPEARAPADPPSSEQP